MTEHSGIPHNQVQPADRQRGAALLILFLVVFIASMTAVLSGLNARGSPELRAKAARNAQMVAAKDALLGFSVMVPDYYPGRGPGALPCPDSNADGLPEASCAGNIPGRLPTRISTTAPATEFALSPIDSLGDQQFWYAVSPLFRLAPDQTLNSNSAAAITVDGVADLVAVIIDAGALRAGQTRPNNTASNYLDGANTGGLNFVSQPADPATLNDNFVSISRRELMSVVVPRVAVAIKRRLDSLPGSPPYPADQVELNTAMIPVTWFADDAWSSQITYVSSGPDDATFSFAGCSISFTIHRTSDTIQRSQNQC